MGIFGPKQTVDKALTDKLRAKGYTTQRIANLFGVKEKDVPKQTFALTEERLGALPSAVQRQIGLSVKQPTRLEKLRSKVIAPTSIAGRGLDVLFPQTEEQRVAGKTISPFDKDLTPEQKKLVQEQVENIGIGAVASLGSIERQIIRQAERSLGRKLVKEESKNIGRTLTKMRQEGKILREITPQGPIFEDILKRAKVKVPKQLNTGAVADDIAKGVEKELALPSFKPSAVKALPAVQVAKPIASQVHKVVAKEVFRGSKGKVSSETRDFGEVKVFAGDQRQAVQELASAGNMEAKAILSNPTDFFVKSDKLLREVYSKDFDAIQYGNSQLPQKGVEYQDLKTGRFYSEQKATAEAYSLQSRGAKYVDEVSDITAEEIKRIEAEELAKVEKPVVEFKGQEEENYSSFVSSMDKLKPFFKLREKIDAGDVDTFKAIMKEKGLLEGDIFRSEELSDSDQFDKFKARLMTEKPELLATKKAVEQLGLVPEREAKVVTKSKEFNAIPDEMKKDITAFFRPSRKQTSRAFQLLGNKNTTIPLFDKIFTDWVAQGVENIIEPYAGAYTLGTHSIQNAIKGGLKEFHSNIFDKEKFNIVKAIQDGKIKEVEKATEDSVELLNNKILEYSTPKTTQVFNDFFGAHPDSYIGSNQWYSWVRDQEIGKDVTVFKDIYNEFQTVFQNAFNDLFKVPVTDLNSSVINSTIKRIGMFGGKGQSLINTNGFRSFENKVFDKYGMAQGFKDIDATMELAKEYGTKIKLYNEDGASMIEKVKKDLMPWLDGKQDATSRLATTAAGQRLGFYFDPPYVLSAKVYKDQVGPDELAVLEKFMSGSNFVRDHLDAFKAHAKGSRMALTNDVEKEYIQSVKDSLDNSTTYAYKEGQTPTSLIVDDATADSVDDFLKTSETVGTGEREEIGIIKEITRDKSLSINTVAGVRKAIGIKELKNATPEKLDELINALNKLEDGDSLLTEKQKEGMSKLLEAGGWDNIDMVTKREFIAKFGEKKDILQGRISKHVAKEIFPTVDIKDQHPIITRIVDKTDIKMRDANSEIKRRSEKINKIMREAELSELSKFKQMTSQKAKLTVGNKIFRAMSGANVELTKEQRAVVAYLRNFFKKAKLDLQLEKSRRYYITNIEASLMEKIYKDGVSGALRSFMKPKSNDIPVDVLLALDNIIGSDKFFKFGLERKGGLTTTDNIRRIVNEYSTLYESKLALDEILPEAQAAQQLLLQDKSKVWMREFLQNLKGRGLDNKFRNSEMGWMVKTADKIIDFNYVRLLGFNYFSAFKNIMGGEINSFVYQDFAKYMRGKKRFITNPKAAYKIITQSGILDGSYVDFADSGLLDKMSKTTRHLLYGGMEVAEYEIRGAYMLGELTKDEWASALKGRLKLSDKRFRKILDDVAITQGIYTKVDSPLFAQTWYGRGMLQFNRWRITNAMLLRRIGNKAKADVGNKEYNTKAVRSVLKMFFSAGLMMYLSYELGKRGYKRARKVTLAGTELIKNIYEIMPPKVMYDIVSRNPAMQILGNVVYTIDQLASHIGFEDPYPIEIKKNIFEMYVAGFRTFGLDKKKEKPKGSGAFAPSKNKLPSFAPKKSNLPSFKF
jgi:hypothetical protein